MNQDSNQTPQRGKTNVFRILAGGYLLYMAFQLFRMLWTGESGKPVLCIVGGIAFAVIGAVILGVEWKAYRYGKQHINDPSTWSDQPQIEEDARENGESEEEK